MSGQDISQFQRFLEENRAKKAEQLRFSLAKSRSADPDLVPEVQFDRKPEDDLIDQAIDQLGIVEAYNKWCGKMKPTKRPGQNEGVMISCPVPGHRDSNPSAWINTDKNTWYCASCEIGGDAYDIAAYHFNLPVPGYKTGAQFHDLRRSMVRDLGYVVQQSASPEIADNIYLPVPVPVPAPIPAVTVAEPAPGPEAPPVEYSRTATEEVSDTIVEEEVWEEPNWLAPTFDWREVVTPGTFLHEYITACSVDDAAEEYHFWNGMLGIGLAVGREITLRDLRPVYANLMVCILGSSGDRKSRSMGYLKDLIHNTLPFKEKEEQPKGVKVIQGAASGEAIIGAFTHPIVDPGNPKIIIGHSPVRGFVEYSELADLVGRANRAGNVIKTVLMQVADTDKTVGTVSVTRGEVKATEPFACVMTSTQPDSLKDLLTKGDTSSGFLNRWIFASGQPKKRIALGGTPVDISSCFDSFLRIHGQVPRQIYWSEDAEKIWTEHFDTQIVPVQKNSDVLARLDLLEKKLILLFAINENEVMIEESHVRKVIRMHGYLVEVYGAAADKIMAVPEANLVFEEVKRHIKRLTNVDHPYGPRWKQINDCIKHKEYEVQMVDRVKTLISKDDDVEVNPGKPGGSGRRTDHYKWVGE